MDPEFLRTRLQSFSKDELIDVIMHVNNAPVFASLFRKDLEPQPKEALVQLIMNAPGAYIDSNIGQDLTHIREAAVFDQLVAFRRQDPNYKPDMWKAKPHQEAHVDRLIRGLRSPTNTARSVWDGSKTGRGKTAAATLAAIGIKVRYVLVICPDAVIKKWHDALKPLGLFDYKLCTYAGLINVKGKGDEKWGRYKPDPDKQSDIRDMEWLKIRRTGLTGINDHFYDWSALPGTDPSNGLGGCLVIWDEVQNAKNISGAKIGVCFKHFTKHLHDESNKFVRALYLSGTIQEKVEDLPYLLNALDYIQLPTFGEQNHFVKTYIAPRFRELMADDWQPGFSIVTDPKIMLILFIRVVVKRQLRFSEIPDPLVYAARALKLIPIDQMEDLIKFYETIMVPNFREMMQEDWREDMEALDATHKFVEVLRHYAKNPVYAHINIADVIDGFFENPITFQGIQLAEDQIARFMEINSDIEALLLEVVRGNKKFDGGLLGQIQKTLSELEVLKLAPFTELARKALMTPLPHGAMGSVVVSCLRNSSVRMMAWRLEAIMLVDGFIKMLKVQEQKYKEANRMDLFATLVQNQEAKFRSDMIAAILLQHDLYIQNEKMLLSQTNNAWLPIKRSFQRYSRTQLMEMPLEDLANEYIKWDYYLNVDKFNFVCIYVSNFGVPRVDEENLESEDELDRIREGKTLSPDQKNFAKETFQANERRIFITNMQIAREGIDLHDTSMGGMHPRTGIISPGIVARYLIQMLGRFVREGQTSESIRIVGYIDNIKGIKSWEAKFMEKLSVKVKDLLLLQTGEMSLDIMNNIEEDGTSIWKQIIEEMAHGGTFSPGESPAVSGTTPPTSGYKPGLAPMAGGGALGNLIQKTFGTKRPTTIQVGPVGFGGSQVETQFLPMKVNETHILFDTSTNPTPDNINSEIGRALVGVGLNRPYYDVINTVNRHGLPAGVIVFRPGFIIGGISQTETLARIEEYTKLKTKREDVPERSLDNYGLNPKVHIDRLFIVFESANSFLLSPEYPVRSKIPQDLFGKGLLEIEPQGKGIIRLKGTTARLILAYYAIRTIALIDSPTIFGEVVTQDPASVLTTISNKYLITNAIKEGKYKIISNVEVIKFFPVVLGSATSLVTALLARQVVDEYKVYTDEYSGVTVLPAYGDLVTKVLGRPPQNMDQPK